MHIVMIFQVSLESSQPRWKEQTRNGILINEVQYVKLLDACKVQGAAPPQSRVSFLVPQDSSDTIRLLCNIQY